MNHPRRPNALWTWPDLRAALREEADCLVWTRSCNRKGYGRTRHGGVSWQTHRLAWSLANQQDIPEGALILHSCDNPPCCNPTHLRPGTVSDNARDAVAHGRQFPRGSQHPNARLTEPDVLAIRALAARGANPYELARRFGVGRMTVRAIISGERWTHV